MQQRTNNSATVLSFLSLFGSFRPAASSALGQGPRLILLDEPTNHLDIRHQVELIDYLHKWSADGNHAVIGVFHDINLALRLTDNVVFMKEGHIVGSGIFDQIADTQFLNDIYETNIAAYMMDSLEKWRKIR